MTADAGSSSRARHARVGSIFRAVIELDPAEREAYVLRACDGDETLVADVRSLLEADAKAASSDRFGEGLGAELVDAGVPETIDSYRLLRRLGAGGMGTVYEARQSEPDRSVALKVLQIHGGEEALRRFRNESQILGRLVHPSIAQVYESGTARTRDGLVPYFAMELVEGTPLDEWAHGRSTDEKLRMIATIARAVGHAHVNGVVHRDLKPANILVNAEGMPKILDFGVAHVQDRGMLATAVETRAGQLVGTLSYMSPEQLSADTQHLDGRCDVYALGVVLYLLLGNRLPLDIGTESLAEAAHRITSVDPPPLGTLDREFRGDIETIVARALEKDADRRYQSAGAFAADLERLLRHEPILARPPTAIYQMTKFARRNPALVGGVAGMIVILLIGSIVSLSFALREAEQRERAAEGFSGVRALVKTFVDDLNASMVDLPGALATRQLLAEKTIGYLELLEREAGEDLEILFDVAVGYSAVGDIQGQPNKPNIGDRAGAVASYERGLAATARMVEIDPRSVKGRRQMAILHERIGNIRMAERAYDEALAAYQSSHGIKLALAEESGDGKLNLSYSLNKLSRVYGRIGQPAAALDAATESLGYRQELLAAAQRAADADDADDAAIELVQERRQQVSTGHNRVGDLLLALDRPNDALREFETAIAIRRALLDAAPSSPGARRDVAVSAYRIALASERLERYDEALAAYETVVEVMAWLSEQTPEDQTAKLDHAGILSAVGALRARHGDAAQARRELTHCLLLLDEVGDDTAAEMHVEALITLARLDVESGDYATARDRASRAVDIATAIVTATPESPALQRLHARSQRIVGDVESRAGRKGSARAAWRAALDAYATAAEQGPVLEADAAAVRELNVLLGAGD